MKSKRITCAASLSLCISIAPPCLAQDFYGGSRGEASTAVGVDTDGNGTIDSMYVGDNEDETLRLYPLGGVGVINPTFSLELTTSPLGFPNNLLVLTQLNGGNTRLLDGDIESSAKIGNTIYWLGSHSNGNSPNFSDPRINRDRFFATTVNANNTLTYVNRYGAAGGVNLKQDLVAWDNLRPANVRYGFAASVGPVNSETVSGFNMEGLAATPSNTLYIGFRSPLVDPNRINNGGVQVNRTNAVVVELLNPAALIPAVGQPVLNVSSAVFGQTFELNLGSRGIRSMEFNGTVYVIVGGGHGGAIPEFAVYVWSGHPAEAPVQRFAGFPGGFNPEGIGNLPAGDLSGAPALYFVSDDGPGGNNRTSPPINFRGQAFSLNADNRPVVTVSIPDALATEPDSGTNNGTIRLTRTAGGLGSALAVNYVVTGSATPGAFGDYTALTGVANFSPGSPTVDIPVTPLNDNAYEGNETVTVTLSANANYFRGPADSGTVTIQSLYNLGTLPGDNASAAYGITSDGRIAGYSASAGGVARAFKTASYTTGPLGAGDALTGFTALFGSAGHSIAFDVTSSNRAGGEWSSAPGQPTTGWYAGPLNYQALRASYPGFDSSPTSVADLEEWGGSGARAAGHSFKNGHYRFCQWYIYDSTPAYTYVYDIGTARWPSYDSFARGISNDRMAGVILNYNGAGNDQAAYWNWTGYDFLLPNGAGNTGSGANDLDAMSLPNVTGYVINGGAHKAAYWYSTAANPPYSFTVTSLAAAGMVHSEGNSVVASSTVGTAVAGTASAVANPVGDSSLRAVVWTGITSGVGGTFVNLDNLKDAGMTSLASAERINSSGHITGFGLIGTTRFAFLLRP